MRRVLLGIVVGVAVGFVVGRGGARESGSPDRWSSCVPVSGCEEITVTVGDGPTRRYRLHGVVVDGRRLVADYDHPPVGETVVVGTDRGRVQWAGSRVTP